MPFIKNAILLVGKSYTPYVPPQIGEVAVGDFHTLIIDKNANTTWAWGAGFPGQLGNLSVLQQNTPVSVNNSNTLTFCKVAAGVCYSMAIDRTGQVWAWGNNSAGRLGDGTITNRSGPVSIAGATKTFCEIATGNFHTIAIDKNGKVWAWGLNSVGQLGNNTIISQITPVSIVGTAKTFCKVTAGGCFTVAIDKNGRAWSWGNNTSLLPLLGDGTTTSRRTPVSVAGSTKTFCKIGSAECHTIAIDKNGKAWAWGANPSGAHGDGTTSRRCTPVAVAGTTKTFCEISSGLGRHSVAIDKNGKAWAWGDNRYWQLGVGSSKDADASIITPVSVAGAPKIFCKVAVGSGHTVAIDSNSNVWAWGRKDLGVLGINAIANKYTPISIAGSVKTFCNIVIDNHIGGRIQSIDKNGLIWGWGGSWIGDNNSSGQSNPITPVSIRGTATTKTFCKIATGNQSNGSIDSTGQVWTWGLNNVGQLGINLSGISTTVRRCTPVTILGTQKTFCEITVGQCYMSAIDKNGKAWSWGINSSGRLGDNTTINKSTPVAVAGTSKTFCKISAGIFTTSAIDNYGKIWSWGGSSSGELGDNTTTAKSTPVAIAGATKTFCEIARGSSHALAIDKNGKVWAWGSNQYGELGDNTTTLSQRTPVSILGATKTFCKISAGFFTSGAIDYKGNLWTWGWNQDGQIGVNSNTSSFITPVQVYGNKTFCQIAVGRCISSAIDNYGKVWIWGGNTLDELGTLTAFVNTPVRVCNL